MFTILRALTEEIVGGAEVERLLRDETGLPVSIADDVVIGAGSVVTKDITEPGSYAGNPARRLKSKT